MMVKLVRPLSRHRGSLHGGYHPRTPDHRSGTEGFCRNKSGARVALVKSIIYFRENSQLPGTTSHRAAMITRASPAPASTTARTFQAGGGLGSNGCMASP